MLFHSIKELEFVERVENEVLKRSQSKKDVLYKAVNIFVDTERIFGRHFVSKLSY